MPVAAAFTRRIEFPVAEFTQLTSAYVFSKKLSKVVVTNGNFGAVYECNFGAFTKIDSVQKEYHWHENAMFNLNKSVVRQCFRKFFFQMHTDIVQIKMFKIFERTKMK